MNMIFNPSHAQRRTFKPFGYLTHKAMERKA
jgi:hypothetical protein